MDISESQWLPRIFEAFEELKAQNEDLLNKVDRLEKIVDKKPLTVNVKEAAKILGYSEEYLRKMDREGLMPKKVSKGSQHSKWNRSDIEKMAESKRKTGRPRKVA